MKIYLKILALFVIMVSCQSNKNEDSSSLGSTVEKEEISQNIDIGTSNHLQSETTLTKKQFTDFFQKQIGAYKFVNVSVLMPSTLSSTLYVKDKDYDHKIIKKNQINTTN